MRLNGTPKAAPVKRGVMPHRNEGGVMAGNKELLARGFAEVFGLIYKPTYLFVRDEGFYPLELKDDADAIANAECNKGTRKVIRAIDETVVWEEVRVTA